MRGSTTEVAAVESAEGTDGPTCRSDIISISRSVLCRPVCGSSLVTPCSAASSRATTLTRYLRRMADASSYGGGDAGMGLHTRGCVHGTCGCMGAWKRKQRAHRVKYKYIMLPPGGRVKIVARDGVTSHQKGVIPQGSRYRRWVPGCGCIAPSGRRQHYTEVVKGVQALEGVGAQALHRGGRRGWRRCVRYGGVPAHPAWKGEGGARVKITTRGESEFPHCPWMPS